MPDPLGLLVEAKDVNIAYGNTLTVQNVSFSLKRGEVLTIVGESGSGKTSVIRALLGVLSGNGRVTQGQLLFKGQDLLAKNLRDWQRLRGKEISMIFQDSGNMLNPVRTIGSQYIEYIRMHSEADTEKARNMALDMLRRMNLPNPETIMASYTFELSGGMRQRVGIAMAITCRPSLLLADEPTSALDVTTQAQIVKELLRVVKKYGAGMIMVTHNIGVAAYMSDKLMVMSGGKVLEYGAAEELIQNPKADYTKELLAAVPEIGGKRYA